MKWEYRMEVVVGAESPSVLGSLFNQLGESGWELVCSVASQTAYDNPCVIYVFKRPKEAS